MAILEPRRSTQDTSQGKMFLTARVTEALLAWWISLASAVSSSSLNSRHFLLSYFIGGAFDSGRYLKSSERALGRVVVCWNVLLLGRILRILLSEFFMTTYHLKVNDFSSAFFCAIFELCDNSASVVT